MEKVFKVYIDPGHGGSDPGIVANGLKEKDLTLPIGLAVRDELERHGVIVKMSRTTDKLRSLNVICNEVNKWDPDLAVSIHLNGGGGDGTEFWSTFYRDSSRGDELGICILKRLQKECKQYSRGLKSKIDSDGSDWFGFVRMINAPSGIIEVAFVDNKRDVVDFDEPEEFKTAGRAIAHGILDFLKIPVKKQPPKAPTKTVRVKVRYLDYYANTTMNFRQKASSTSKKIGVIPKGTVFRGDYLRSGWVRTTYKGRKGYVRYQATIKKQVPIK